MSRSVILLLAILCGVLMLASCSASKDPRRQTIKQLQRGRLTEDTSYAYALPYKGKAQFLVQGYYSLFSHKNRAALDFKMKKGTPIFAARAGVVVRLREDGNRGGWNKKNRPYGNFIIIQHSDGSRAGYWHLKYNSVLPNLGDTIQQGQPIALSGNTGYTLFPHLHFLAWQYDGAGRWQPIATRFSTRKGIRYLRPGKWYRP